MNYFHSKLKYIPFDFYLFTFLFILIMEIFNLEIIVKLHILNLDFNIELILIKLKIYMNMK